MSRAKVGVALILLVSIQVACDSPEGATSREAEPAAVAQEELDLRWLSAESDEARFQELESQLGGFSQSMIEVGHRYNDLYFAVEDRNWDYAEYQVEKIGDAIERGIIRRPGRADTARVFLDEAIPDLQGVIEARNVDGIDEAMNRFTAQCMTCHVEERVPFMVITPPEVRLSPIAAPQ